MIFEETDYGFKWGGGTFQRGFSDERKIGRTEVKKLLVAERKSMREKAKSSLLMRRTLSIYNGMKKRAAEAGVELDFDLEKFRNYVKLHIGGQCCYCPAIITEKKFQAEHGDPIARGGEFGFQNINISCPSCNWQKSTLFAAEFLRLQEFLNSLNPIAAADIRRRLTIGGKWSWK